LQTGLVGGLADFNLKLLPADSFNPVGVNHFGFRGIALPQVWNEFE
jgi:hypothetical protein